MLSLELESGFDRHETTNSYFAYVEERQIREAELRDAVKLTNEPGTIVVGILKTNHANTQRN